MEQKSQRLARRIAALFIFILAVVLFQDRLTILRHGVDSSQWPNVVGEVISAEARPVGGGRAGGTWSIRVQYRYTVDEQAYTGSRIRFTRSLNARLDAEVELAMLRFQSGQPIRVYHHPQRHRISVLEPGSDRSGWLGIVLSGLLFAVAIVFWLVPTRRVGQRHGR